LEAAYLRSYIANGGDSHEFLSRFHRAVSKAFDPEKHFKRIGVVNQTTMLGHSRMVTGSGQADRNNSRRLHAE
jgi:hypothetical protein